REAYFTRKSATRKGYVAKTEGRALARAAGREEISRRGGSGSPARAKPSVLCALCGSAASLLSSRAPRRERERATSWARRRGASRRRLRRRPYPSDRRSGRG